jgi:hypothetical protein
MDEFGNPDKSPTHLMRELARIGVQIQFCLTETPEQNGLVERYA